MSAASIEKSRPSGASFNAAVNPVRDKSAYLEEKGQWGQAPIRRSWALQYQLQHQFGAEESQHQQEKPARVKRTAVWLRQPS